jgi:hypothetical protein
MPPKQAMQSRSLAPPDSALPFASASYVVSLV